MLSVLICNRFESSLNDLIGIVTSEYILSTPEIQIQKSVSSSSLYYLLCGYIIVHFTICGGSRLPSHNPIQRRNEQRIKHIQKNLLAIDDQ